MNLQKYGVSQKGYAVFFAFAKQVPAKNIASGERVEKEVFVQGWLFFLTKGNHVNQCKNCLQPEKNV